MNKVNPTVDEKKTFIVQYQADAQTGSRVFQKIGSLIRKHGFDADMIVSDVRYKGFVSDEIGMVQLKPDKVQNR